MKDKQQTMRYTDKELRLIKNTFAENDDILKRIRKVMLQMPLNEIDLEVLKSIKKPEVLAILRKTFLPTIDPDAPLNQVIDLWMTVQIAEKTPDEALPHLMARNKMIEYTDQQLKALESGAIKGEKLKFDELINLESPDTEATMIYINLITRNTIISHVEMQLSMLKILAGLKDETPEQTQERLKKDSTK